MRRRGAWMRAAAIAAAFFCTADARAERRDGGGDNPWRLCADAIADHERSERIPRHLLAAIAMAESGRWDARREAKAPWPWTVMAEGEGKFYDTKAQAVRAVEALRAREVRNIDVGCMQINLMHHPEAFDDLDQAFEPVSNVGYGARHLKALFDETRSWQQAAGRYHSATPERSRDYRLKVVRLWNEQRREAADERRQTTGRRALVPVDRKRTDELNAWGRRMAANARALSAATAPPTRLSERGWAGDAALAGDLARTLHRRLDGLRSAGAIAPDRTRSFAAPRRPVPPTVPPLPQTVSRRD